MKDFKIMEAKILSGDSECHEHKRKKLYLMLDNQ